MSPEGSEVEQVIKNKQTELLENSSVRLTITVAEDAVRKEYDELLKEYVNKVRLDGFRKGKVPPNILLRKYGEVILGETTERVLQKSLEQALEASEQKPIATSIPTVDAVDKLELGKEFSYKVTFDTYPKIELPEYKGLEYEELEVAVEEEDVERELKGLQEQNSIVVDKKEPVIAKGDIVNVDYAELGEDGAEKTATRRQSFVFEVGSGYNPYRFDEQIVGMKAGEEKAIAKEYPADFEVKPLAGRKLGLKVKVNTVKEKQLPEINDELAQDISDKFKSLDDLKKDIREKLALQAARRAREHSISQLLDKIASAALISLPKSMLDNELEEEWQRFLGRLRADEATVLKELAKEGRSKQSLQEEWRPAAEKKLRLQLAVSEMVKREGLQASEEEVNSRVQADAEARSITFEQAKEIYTKNRLLDFLSFDIKNEKLYELLLSSGKRKPGKKVKILDLLAGNY
jgi:trigger factor